MVKTLDLKIQSLFILSQNVFWHFWTIYCGIIAICLPHIAIYRDTLMAYRDSPNFYITFHMLACLVDFTGKFSNPDHKKKASQRC